MRSTMASFFLFLAFTAGSLAGDAAPTAINGDDLWTGKVVIITVRGSILPSAISSLLLEVNKVMERVRREKPRLLLVEIDSPGGEIFACGELSEKILRCHHDWGIPTVALVLKDAISGGAMLATACREIVMLTGSRIGDVQPMTTGPTGLGNEPIDERTAEKYEAYVRSILAAHATANGYPKRLLEAMVSRTRDKPLLEIVFTDGSKEYLSEQEMRLLEEEIRSGRDKRAIASRRQIVEHGKLLTLSAEEAHAYGIAKAVVKTVEDFFASQGINPQDICRHPLPEGKFDLGKLAEEWGFRKWELALLAIFLTLGLAGLFGEIQHPGAGFPAAISLIGFCCFFYILFRHGSAEWYEVALVIIGITLLIVEIILIPGFGVIGILGFICMVVGLFLAFVPSLDSPYMRQHPLDALYNFSLVVGGAILATAIIGYYLIKHGSRMPLLQSLYLSASLPSGREVRAAVLAEERAEQAETAARLNPNAALVGKRGVALTALRPSGKIRLEGGEILDVVSDGSYIEADTAVVIKATDMNRILVSRAQDA